MSDFLLSGLKVVDASIVIAGPAAAMMLADFGADVVKIEKPGRGDMLRMLSNIPDAVRNYMWQMDGRNKRSIAVDLKSEDGQEIVHRLAAECDVFITNMPYASRTSLRLTYEDIRALNDDVIYASLTAYGEKGPERERKGFDQLAYWARSGLMDLMREPGTRPTQGLPGMGDHPTAVSIFAGIMTALLHRERTGEGSMVETSLLANGLWSNSAIAQGVLAGGDMGRYRDATKYEGYSMRPYRAQDGRWLQFNMVRNTELVSLMFTALDLLHLLVDERFATPQKMYQNRYELADLIASRIAEKPSDEWLKLCDDYDVPVNRIAIVEETKDDEQVLVNEMAVRPDSDDIEVPLLLRHPVKVSSLQHPKPTRGPELGEHSRQILQELGYDQEQIERLKDMGVFSEPGEEPST